MLPDGKPLIPEDASEKVLMKGLRFTPRSFKLSVVGIAFVLIAFHLFSAVDRMTFHGDETLWISQGYYYYRLFFVQHDFTLEKWRPKQFVAPEMNMPVGKYLIGFAMNLMLPEGNYVYEYDWSKSFSVNKKLGNVPALSVLRPGRYMCAAVSLATCIAMFWLCWKTWNWITGTLAALILSFNPIFTMAASRAMIDSFLAFFFILSQLICLALFRNRNKSRAVVLALSGLAGLCAGLCLSTKLNGLITLVYPSLLFGYLFLLAPKKKEASFIYTPAFAVMVFCCVVTAVLVNPIFYSWSVKIIAMRFLYILQEWKTQLADLQRMFVADAIHGFPIILFARIAADYFYPILFCALLLGLFLSTKKVVREFRAKKAAADINPVVFFIVNLSIVSAWIPFDWDRYYLPIIIAEAPLAAYGVFWLGEKTIRVLAATKRPEPCS